MSPSTSSDAAFIAIFGFAILLTADLAKLSIRAIDYPDNKETGIASRINALNGDNLIGNLAALTA